MIFYKDDGCIRKTTTAEDLFFGWWLSDPLTGSEGFNEQYFSKVNQKDNHLRNTCSTSSKVLLSASKTVDSTSNKEHPAEIKRSYPEDVVNKNTLPYTFKGVSAEINSLEQDSFSNREVYKKILLLLNPDCVGTEQLQQIFDPNAKRLSRLKLYKSLKNLSSRRKKSSSENNKKIENKPVPNRLGEEKSSFGSSEILSGAFSNRCQEQENKMTSKTVTKTEETAETNIAYPLVPSESPYFGTINDIEQKINIIREDILNSKEDAKRIYHSYTQDLLHCQRLLDNARKMSREWKEERLLNDILWLLSGDLHKMSLRKWPFRINRHDNDKNNANYII